MSELQRRIDEEMQRADEIRRRIAEDTTAGGTRLRLELMAALERINDLRIRTGTAAPARRFRQRRAGIRRIRPGWSR